MRFFDYIGEFFLFRWLFGRSKKNAGQQMSGMNTSYRNNNDRNSDPYYDMDEADCLGHHDYGYHEDVLDEREDYDMMDYDCHEDFHDEWGDFDMMDDDF